MKCSSKFFLLFVFVLVCTSPFTVFAGYSATEKARMVADLDILRNEIEINYAPAQWKKTHIQWDLETEIEMARQKILGSDNLTTRDYQHILRDLFNSLQDHHVNVSFYSTEFAALPFLVQGVNRRYFVVWISEGWKESHDIPLEVGDEILFFDGCPVCDVIDNLQLSAYGSSNKSASFQHLAELLLTVREGDSLQKVPFGKVEIVFKKSNQTRFQSFFTEWFYVPEEIDQDFPFHYFTEVFCLGNHPFFFKSRTLPLFTRWQRYHPENIYGSKWLGDKKSLFPYLGPVIWKSAAESFDAYIYTLKGKNIGYVRIPDFMGNAKKNEEFREIIAVMQKRTEALIIDVMNNPGGLAFYTFGLLSMLSEKPLINLTEQLAITQKDVYFALDDLAWLSDVTSDQEAVEILGSDICGFPVDLKFAQSLVKMGHYIKDQYAKGNVLTDPYPLEGLELIDPHFTTRYTKPLYVLTNSLSISCGDVFPAILQDNKRAKIIGMETAGAGGYVIKNKYSNRFGLAGFTLTGSLILRSNGNPLENLGVTPDFPYEFTENDYIYKYSNFIKYINNCLLK